MISDMYQKELRFLQYHIVKTANVCISHKIYAQFGFSLFVVIILSYVADLDNPFDQDVQASFTGNGASIWLPQCLWRNPERYVLNWFLPVHNT